MIINLISIALIMLIASLIEVIYDKQLTASFDKSNEALGQKRTKIQNDLIHKLQIPNRALIIFLAVFSTGSIFDLLVWGYAMSMYWFLFDLMVNLIWLKKPIWYWGGTSKVDLFFGKNHLWIKICLILVFALKLLFI